MSTNVEIETKTNTEADAKTAPSQMQGRAVVPLKASRDVVPYDRTSQPAGIVARYGMDDVTIAAALTLGEGSDAWGAGVVEQPASAAPVASIAVTVTAVRSVRADRRRGMRVLTVVRPQC